MRALFLFDAHKYFTSTKLPEILHCFVSAVELDIATASYLILPGLLFSFIWLITNLRIFKNITFFYHLLLTLFYIGLAISEIYLYREWQSKIGYDSLKHFAHFSEVIKTPSVSMLLGFIIGTTIIFISFKWIFKRWVFIDLSYKPHPTPASFYLFSTLLYLTFTACFVIGMRGGLNRFPIGMGAAYYSSKSALNDGATNVLWHAVYSLLNTSEFDRLQPFIDNKPDKEDFFTLYNSPPDTFPGILKTIKPNIIFLLLESWPADVCLTIGRDSLIAPHFNKLIKKGFYFSNCYAIGHVSDQGVPATLGALPVIPAFSPLTGKQLVGELPCIVDELKAKGYYTGFLYGGQLDYGNIRSYVYKKGFDKIADVQNFPPGTEKTALGVPDLPMYKHLLSEISQIPQPFMYCGYTISSHSPYDVPVDYKLGIGGISEPFINTVHYADSAIHVFIENAKKQPWYENTLFVMVADHSHESQIVRVKEDKERYKIPLLLFGPALKQQYEGTNFDKVMSQLDIIGLLYGQMKIPYEKKYPFTRNPLKANAPEIVFYNFPGGSGIISNQGTLTKDLNYEGKNTKDLKDPKTEKSMIEWVDKYLYEAAVYLKKI